MIKSKKVFKQSLAMLLVFVLFLAGLPLSASAADNVKVNLTLGKSLSYESYIDWSTHMMYADGSMAYCINPALKAPSGTFSINGKNLIEITSSDSRHAMLSKALYYCYGGSGFNKKVDSFVTKTNHGQPAYETYSGRTMSAFMGNLKKQYQLSQNGSDLHYLLTHRVLAKICGDDDWGYALTSYWRWAVEDIEAALKKAPAAPKGFIYILDPKNDCQKVILQKSVIKLQLQKASANPDITNGNSCYSLEGARYNIYLSKSAAEKAKATDNSSTKDYFSFITTNKKGYGKYGAGTNGADVPLQTYYVKEVTAPKGYALDPNVYEIKNTGKMADGVPVYRPYDTGTKKYEVKDEPKNDPVNVLLKKIDKNGKGLANAEFTVKYYACAKDELTSSTKAARTWVFRTDGDGFTNYSKNYIVSGDSFYQNYGIETIPIGTITIQETKAPDGYIIDNTVHTVEIKDDGKSIPTINTYNYPEITNDEKPGKIKIVKTSDDNIVGGIRFNISYTDVDGKKVTDTVTTGSDGTIIKDYYEGTYTITEVVDETKYFPQSPQTVKVKAGKTATVKFHNKLTTQDFTIHKTSSDGNVSGITFHIKDNATGKTIDKITDDKGYVTVEGLTIDNTYTVTEEVPEGYEPQKPQTITLKANTINILNFHNIRQTGNLVIKKESTDGKLDGHYFTVRPADSYDYLTPMQGLATNSNGEIRFEAIPTGDYIVTEVGGWDMYYTNPEPEKTIKVTKNSTGTYTAVNFKNTLITKPVKIVKTSDDGNVAGITFKITGFFTGTRLETREFTTDENGVICDDFPASYWYDEWTVEEVVPDGYESQPPQTFTLDPESDEVTELHFHNVSKPKIEIIKTSDDGIVEGIPFDISYIDNDGYTVSERFITDADGKILCDYINGDHVESGVEYTITEEVPEGYAAQEAQTITPKPGETATVKFHNSVVSQIEVIKTSEDAVIEGVWFALYSNGSLIGHYQTNAEGKVTIDNLPAYSNGKLLNYSVKELGFVNEDGTYSIPDRYNAPSMQTKQLVKNETTIFEFNNTLKRGNITIRKRGVVNSTQPVSDVVLNIYDSAGNVLLFRKDEIGNYIENSDGSADVVTDSAGNAKILNLIYGDYTVREVKAATGYHLLKEDVVITLQSANATKTIHNTEKTEFPNAGANDKAILIFIGAGTAIIGTLTFIYFKKKEKERKM